MKDKRRRTVNIDNIDELINRNELKFNVAFKHFVLYLESRSKSPMTIENYRKQIFRFIKYATQSEPPNIEAVTIDINAITLNTIEMYIQYLTFEKQLKANSVNAFIKAMRTFYKFLERTYNVKNICAHLEEIRNYQNESFTPNDEQIAEFYSCFDLSIFIHMRTFTICKLMENTGIRIMECTKLKIDNLDFNTNELRVIGKGSKNRKIPMNRTIVDIVKIWLKVRGEVATDFLFITEDNEPITLRTISYHIKKMADFSGIPITAHSLRRRFISRLVNNNINLVLIAKLIGHSNVSLLHTYYGISKVESKKAVNTLNRIKKSKN